MAISLSLSQSSLRDLSIYRYPIAHLYFLLLEVVRTCMYKAYHSILDVYEDFAPVHRKRIKGAAVEQLPRPSENNTGLSFAATDVFLDEMSQTHSRTPRKCYRATVLFRKPRDPCQQPAEARDGLNQRTSDERQENTELKEQQQAYYFTQNSPNSTFFLGGLLMDHYRGCASMG